MQELIVGSLLLSLLHALLPNHWLPMLALGRQYQWTQRETEGLTVIAGLAHALSTIAIGVIVGFAGLQLAQVLDYFTHWIAPAILIGMGLVFIWRHHTHHHFHLHSKWTPDMPKRRLIGWLVLAMFFSPCLEIEAYFFAAGAYGWHLILIISLIYLVISVTGMWVWVHWAYPRLLKLNWHTLEHNAGIITGAMLILTGIFAWFHA